MQNIINDISIGEIHFIPLSLTMLNPYGEIMNRWTGCFDSPNQAAVELALAGCILTAVISHITDKSHNENSPKANTRRHLAAALLLLPMLMTMRHLALTQSRAGWLSFTTAIIVMRIWGGIPSRIAFASIFTLIVSISFCPSGLERVGELKEEAIRGERWELWKGACSLIYDYPMGIGGSFSDIQDAWYLPATLEGRFSTALNDTLTCAAIHGIPICISIILTVFFIIGGSWTARGNRITALAVGLLSVHIIAGQFQAHQFSEGVPRATGLITIFSLMLVTLLSAHWNGTWKSAGIHGLWWGGAAASLAIIIILISINACADNSPWKTKRVGIDLIAEPRRNTPIGLAVIFADSDGDARSLRHDLAAHMRNDGWATSICVDRDPETTIHELQSKGTSPTLVIAYRQSATLAWKAVRHGRIRIPAVALDPYDLPTGGNTISSDKTKQSILIITQRYAPFVPDLESLKAELLHDEKQSMLIVTTKATAPRGQWGPIAKWISGKS